MNADTRCVLMVGGSHSVHVKIPARMIRQAGYRVVLGDLQAVPAADAAETFDAVYPLHGHLQRLLLKLRGHRSATASASHDEEKAGQSIPIERPTRATSYLWRLARGWLQSGRLLAAVRCEHPGLVYFQSMTAGSMTAYYLLHRLGWPSQWSRPGLLTHLWGYQPRFAGIRRREICALREFDHIHTSSPAMARIYRENYEVPAEQIDVFVRGINLQTFAPRDASVLDAARAQWKVPADKFVIIHNRHLHPMYRVDIAVDAFIELARRKHDVFLMLVRGGMCQADYERALLGKLQAAGLGGRVALMPPVLTAEQMAVALQLSHCCVNCVPFDAFPVSILEAMYCRSVPVVRDLESYSQFVKPGQTAFAVGSHVDQYVGRIEQLILQPALRRQLTDAGVALVTEQGSEEIFRRNTLNLIERCWHEW